MFHMRKIIYLILISVLLFSLSSHGVVGEDKVLYQKDVDRMLEEGNYNFSGCIFKENINFSGKTLIDADFSNAVFEEEVNFKNTTFKNTDDKDTKFIQTHFKRNAHFEDAIFEGRVAFNSATFEQAVFFQRENNKEKIAFQKGVSFSHTRFGGEEKEEECTIDFTNVIFDDYANFEYAIFNGKTIFEKAKFLDDAIRFVHVKFYGETNFRDAEFNEKGGYTTFYRTNFTNKMTDFRRTVFAGKITFAEVNFSNKKIDNEVNFNGATFEDEAIFVDTVFGDRTYFTLELEKKKKTIFKSGDFRNAIFKEVHFNYAIFEDYLDFRGATCNQTTEFINCIFKGEVDFSALDEKVTSFGDYTNFDNAIFEKKVKFYKTKFKGNVEFKKTIFKEETDFKGVLFEQNTYFNNAIFEKRVNFIPWWSEETKEKTIFSKEGGSTSFEGTKFYDNVQFYDCIFNNKVNFCGSQFYGDTRFIETTFEKELIFYQVRFGQIFYFRPKKVDIIDLKYFEGFGHAQFKETNLEKTAFYGAYLGNVDFIDCYWRQPFMIYEETEEYIKDCSEKNITFCWKLEPKDLEKIYRNLKISFQNCGDNEMAGKFFYREMEMKRKGTSFRSDPKEWILLRVLWPCGYGERLFRLLICSLIIIFGFAGLFWVLGIEAQAEVGNYRSYYWKINNRNRIKNLFKTFIQNPICFLSKVRTVHICSINSFILNLGKTDFAFCLLFSISSFSTLGSNYIKPKSNASRWLSAIESLIGAFFIALFIYVFARKMLR